MSPLSLQLAIGAVCVLAAMALGVGAILAEQKNHRLLRERLVSYSAPYMRPGTAAMGSRGPAGRSGAMERAIAAGARVFGYHPAQSEYYPMKWWAVLGLTLAAARLVAGMAEIFLGAAALMATPVLWAMLSRSVFGWSEQRRRDALFAQFPDALAMIVRALRVGIPLGEGIRTVAREASAPTRAEFALLHDRLSVGGTLEDALRDMARRNEIPEYRFFATTLALQSQTGGGLTEALDGLAETMRRRLALKARGHALAAEAKTSIIILASLPFVAGGALAVLNPDYVGRLFVEPECQKVLLAACMLLGGGLLVMRGMIRQALS